jgi:Protein of unknown function (DUF1670)
MGRAPLSATAQSFEASARKTFHSAVCHLLHSEFPGVFGPAITDLLARQIDDLYTRFHPPGSRFRVGQVLWAAVAVDDPPARDKRIEQTRLVPVVLDLVTAQDIHETTTPGARLATRRKKIIRLCRQAHTQGGVLSLADLALLMHVSINTISRKIMRYERGGGDLVPRRGTVHDMGPWITHKAIICYKRLVEQKPTSQVAQETFHSVDEVEYYVQCFRRVQLCRDSGMSKEDIAQATGHSPSLVQEYLDLMAEFKLPPLPNTTGTDTVQSTQD